MKNFQYDEGKKILEGLYKIILCIKVINIKQPEKHEEKQFTEYKSERCHNCFKKERQKIKSSALLTRFTSQYLL